MQYIELRATDILIKFPPLLNLIFILSSIQSIEGRFQSQLKILLCKIPCLKKAILKLIIKKFEEWLMQKIMQCVEILQKYDSIEM